MGAVVLRSARRHAERHRGDRVSWLRAAVLGANDGLLSTASLVLGVVASGVDHRVLLLTSASGLVAGAMSMAAGEYVSVHAQADSEGADLARERAELVEDPVGEHKELTNIYVQRGLAQALAEQVAAQLMAHDALGAHTRDELGMSDVTAARPLQAAWASAASFSVGASLPIGVVLLLPLGYVPHGVVVASLAFLVALGATSARMGGASVWPSAWRVGFWGAFAMAVTAGAGACLGALTR
jgi:VIT1/CCC1 family predicted Fe2+/Mn2+ transporter